MNTINGVESCKHNLHGRIVWPKGNTSLIVVGLHNKLSTLWKSIGKWGVTSLVKGYFKFSLSTIKDVIRVIARSSWNLSPVYLKPFPSSKYLNPSDLKQTASQVWVRIHGLSQEYWRQKKIVFHS